MKTTHLRSTIARRAAIASLVVSLVTASAGPVAFASSMKKKHLSQSAVTILVSFPTSSQAIWIAQQKGYFAKQGLNVTLLNVNSGSAALVAALVGGAGQFDAVDLSSTALSVQGGAPTRAIMAETYANPQELVLNATAAAAQGIPASGTTQATATKQLLALKGSHFAIAESTVSSPGYTYFLAVVAKNGLTIGPSGDITIQTVGSVANEVTAFDSGKVQGFVNTPPTSVVAGTTVVELSKIPPALNGYWTGVSTTTSMIQSHSDTVQAVVNAITQGWILIRSHPSEAIRVTDPMYAQNSITSPEEIDYLMSAIQSHELPTIALTKKGYAAIQQAIDIADPTTPLTVPFHVFVDNKYADAAIKTYGLKVPSAP